MTFCEKTIRARKIIWRPSAPEGLEERGNVVFILMEWKICKLQQVEHTW